MQPIRAFATLSFLVFTTAACSGGGPVLPPDDNGQITANRRDAGTDSETDGGVTSDPDGGADPEHDAGPVDPTSQPPTLASVSMHQAGRDGADVVLRVAGADANGDLVAFVARFLDAGGIEMLIVDTDLDGRPDSGYLIAGPDLSMAGETEFTVTVTLEDVFAKHPDISEVEVFALDQTSQASAVLTASIETQAVSALGAACDETYVDDRCEEGLGCKGEPLVCTGGEAPEITDFAYFTTPDGYRILIAGEDPDDDIWRVVLEFLDSTGAPVMLDLDNDLTPESDRFEIVAEGRSDDGHFYIALEPTQTFVDEVERLAAVPYDSRQAEGTRLETSLRRPPARRVGQSCDPHGFEVCNTGDVCFPGVVGENNTCNPVEGRRSRTCSDAPALNPTSGVTRLAGVATGVSLWDPPAGCAVLDPKGRPEGVVNLDLPNGASRVTLTTNLPGTGFNTVLYVVDGCALDRDPVLGCHDNLPSSINSELELFDLPAGRYLVVVDSWSPYGGAFEIEVDVEE